MGKPKFKVGQIVVMKSLKKQLPFRVLEVHEFEGEYFYRWDRKNHAAEHMIRELTDEEIGRGAPHGA
jgi:hypothetical protein